MTFYQPRDHFLGEKKAGKKKTSHTQSHASTTVHHTIRQSVCVCVCLCVSDTHIPLSSFLIKVPLLTQLEPKREKEN